MESATLTPPRREHGLLARLRAAPAHAWARAAFAVLCVGAIVGYLVGHVANHALELLQQHVVHAPTAAFRGERRLLQQSDRGWCEARGLAQEGGERLLAARRFDLRERALLGLLIRAPA